MQKLLSHRATTEAGDNKTSFESEIVVALHAVYKHRRIAQQRPHVWMAKDEINLNFSQQRRQGFKYFKF